MAPEPQPTSTHVSWDSEPTLGPDFSCRSVSTSSTISCTESINKKGVFQDLGLIYCCVCDLQLFLTSVSGLGMNTGGLSFSVRSLKSHSSMMYCTGILHITGEVVLVVTIIRCICAQRCGNLPRKTSGAEPPHLLCLFPAEELC